MTLPLFPHQAEAIKIAKTQANLALFHDPGLGKTRSILEIFRNYKAKMPQLKLLVICPLSIIDDAWGKNIKKFTPEFSMLNLRKISKKRWGLVHDIMIINYEMLLSKKKYEFITGLANESPMMVALDESSRLKNPNSKTTKILLTMRNLFLAHFIMSGTPAPNGEYEYWGQVSFLDDNILPDNFMEFRNRFFYLERGSGEKAQKSMVGYRPGKMLQEGWKIKITQEKRNLLAQKMQGVVHRADKATALPSLPPKVVQNRLVTLTADERVVYTNMKKHLLVEIDGQVITAPQIITKLMKLRQQTSGFIYDGKREAHWYGNSKIRELMVVLEELGKQQVIIWCEFQEEINELRKLLNGRCVTMYGKTKDKDEQRESFLSGEKQYLLAHPMSAAHGLTFNNCSTMVYFNNSWSYEHNVQTQDRIHRPGQIAQSCLYIYLVVKDTIDDELIYPTLANKGECSEEMLNKFVGRKR